MFCNSLVDLRGRGWFLERSSCRREQLGLLLRNNETLGCFPAPQRHTQCQLGGAVPMGKLHSHRRKLRPGPGPLLLHSPGGVSGRGGSGSQPSALPSQPFLLLAQRGHFPLAGRSAGSSWGKGPLWATVEFKSTTAWTESCRGVPGTWGLTPLRGPEQCGLG